MDMRFVSFAETDLKAEDVAALLVRADEILYRIHFGNLDNAIRQIATLLEKESDVDHMFNAAHLSCIYENETFIGVLITYLGSEMKKVEKNTWWLLVKQMGFLSFFKRLRAYKKVRQVTKISMEPTALYIFTLVIKENNRFNGYGEKILNHLHEDHEMLYLHVNYKNSDAIRFYDKVGFEKYDEYYDCYKSEPVGALVMRRHRKQTRD